MRPLQAARGSQAASRVSWALFSFIASAVLILFHPGLTSGAAQAKLDQLTEAIRATTPETIHLTEITAQQDYLSVKGLVETENGESMAQLQRCIHQIEHLAGVGRVQLESVQRSEQNGLPIVQFTLSVLPSAPKEETQRAKAAEPFRSVAGAPLMGQYDIFFIFLKGISLVVVAIGILYLLATNMSWALRVVMLDWFVRLIVFSKPEKPMRLKGYLVFAGLLYIGVGVDIFLRVLRH